jgi:hypothetical protein
MCIIACSIDLPATANCLLSTVVKQVGNLSEHARAKEATQLRGIHVTRVYKRQQMCKYCQMFDTK